MVIPPALTTARAFDGVIASPQVLRIAIDSASGLEHLHPTVVHRDLKVRCGLGFYPVTLGPLHGGPACRTLSHTCVQMPCNCSAAFSARCTRVNACVLAATTPLHKLIWCLQTIAHNLQHETSRALQ